MKKLTGQELNLYERAGFVVLRDAFDAAGTKNVQTEILAHCRDILGDSIREERVGLPADSEWRRMGGSSLEAVPFELAFAANSVYAVAAETGEALFLVVPGSHLNSIHPENSERSWRNASEGLQGRICVRLEAGDMTLISPALVYRNQEIAETGRFSCWKVEKMIVWVAETEYNSVPFRHGNRHEGGSGVARKV